MDQNTHKEAAIGSTKPKNQYIQKISEPIYPLNRFKNPVKKNST